MAPGGPLFWLIAIGVVSLIIFIIARVSGPKFRNCPGCGIKSEFLPETGWFPHDAYKTGTYNVWLSRHPHVVECAGCRRSFENCPRCGKWKSFDAIYKNIAYHARCQHCQQLFNTDYGGGRSPWRG